MGYIAKRRYRNSDTFTTSTATTTTTTTTATTVAIDYKDCFTRMAPRDNTGRRRERERGGWRESGAGEDRDLTRVFQYFPFG